MNGIMDRETFEKLPTENKLDVLYDMLEKVSSRLDCLERPPAPRLNKTLMGVASFAGAAIASAIAYFTKLGVSR